MVNLPVTAAHAEKANYPKASIVDSTCAILRLLARLNRAAGVNAIARELGMPPSSCFKILKQLQAQDFVECDESDKSYSLGAGVIPLGRRALDPANIYSLLRPLLEEAAQQHGCAIGLWRILPKQRMVLAGFVEDNTSMRIHMTVGQRLPRLMGAVGRSIAAAIDLTQDETRQEFDTLHWRGPLTYDDYWAGVKFAREHGYAVDIGHFAPGVCTVATTISDNEGKVQFGLSAIMFQGQQDDLITTTIGRSLIQLAHAAAVQIGWSRAAIKGGAAHGFS